MPGTTFHSRSGHFQARGAQTNEARQLELGELLTAMYMRIKLLTAMYMRVSWSSKQLMDASHRESDTTAGQNISSFKKVILQLL